MQNLNKIHQGMKSKSKALKKVKGLERFKNFKLDACKECGSRSVHTHQ